MRKLIEQPYLLLLVVPFIAMPLVFMDTALDVQFHDVYFVVESSTLSLFWFIVSSLFVVAYQRCQGLIWSRLLTFVHVIFTVAPLVDFLISHFTEKEIGTYTFDTVGAIRSYSGHSTLLWTLFLLAQGVFVINLVLGFMLNKDSNT